MFDFLKEFIKNRKIIGAIAPSSKYLANKIIENIDFNHCNCIIEYGAGTGVFTEKIISRKQENTLFLVFEKNISFANHLKKIYIHKKNVKIINDGAENIFKYLYIFNISKIDYIISGLPFASLPKDISIKILKNTNIVLNNDGTFITFQYSLVKKHLFSIYFNNISITKVFLNLPPAYILKCSSSNILI